MAFAPCLREQTTAQLGERGWSAAVRQIGTGLKPAHHLVAIDGVGKALPAPKIALWIRNALQQQLLVGDQAQWHTQVKEDEVRFGCN